jgi:hypothetical protein
MYLTLSLKHHVLELVDVKPVSWLATAFVFCLLWLVRALQRQRGHDAAMNEAAMDHFAAVGWGMLLVTMALSYQCRRTLNAILSVVANRVDSTRQLTGHPHDLGKVFNKCWPSQELEQPSPAPGHLPRRRKRQSLVDAKQALKAGEGHREDREKEKDTARTDEPAVGESYSGVTLAFLEVEQALSLAEEVKVPTFDLEEGGKVVGGEEVQDESGVAASGIAASGVAAAGAVATRFKVGDQVTILKRGTQAGMQGEVVDPDWSGRVKIEVEGATKSYFAHELVHGAVGGVGMGTRAARLSIAPLVSGGGLRKHMLTARDAKLLASMQAIEADADKEKPASLSEGTLDLSGAFIGGSPAFMAGCLDIVLLFYSFYISVWLEHFADWIARTGEYRYSAALTTLCTLCYIQCCTHHTHYAPYAIYSTALTILTMHPMLYTVLHSPYSLCTLIGSLCYIQYCTHHTHYAP